jgi:hypothetical protein
VVGSVGAPTRPKIKNWFPHTVTDKSAKWLISTNPNAARVRRELGIDNDVLRGTFVPNRLQVGDTFFGYKLQKEDIAGGIKRLNQIAREQGKLKFDFYDTDAARALTKFADKHARDLAFISTVDNMASMNEFMRYRTQIESTVTPAIYDSLETSIDNLETLINRLEPADLQKFSIDEIEKVRGDIQKLFTFIENKLDAGQNIPYAEVVKSQIDELQKFISDIWKASPGLPPTVPQLLLDEADKLAQSLYNEVNGLTDIFRMTPATRWQAVQFENIEGFTALNNALLPDVAVRNDIAELFNNIEKLNNPKTAAAYEQYIKGYTSFLKTYATLSPGFHFRNAMSNAFMFAAAGGEPTNLIEE